MIPSEEQVEQYIEKIDPRKSQGCDMIPLHILSSSVGKNIVHLAVQKAMKQEKPNKILFTSRLVCFNKKKDGSTPSLNDIRGIEVTGAVQKIIEHHLLSYI